MGAEALVFAAIAASVATTAIQVDESQKARKEAKRAAKRQSDEQNRLIREQEAAEKRRREDEAKVLQSTVRQRARRTATPRRRETILTTPLGVQGGSNEGQQKTLLGS